MTLALSAFSTFDTTDTSNLVPRWRRYVQRFENRATALNILSAERKIALLLDYAGEAVYDDFQTLVVPAPEAENPRDIYQHSLQALNDLYAPKVQVEYERFNFREATQLLDENLDQLVTRLKKLAADHPEMPIFKTPHQSASGHDHQARSTHPTRQGNGESA